MQWNFGVGSIQLLPGCMNILNQWQVRNNIGQKCFGTLVVLLPIHAWSLWYPDPLPTTTLHFNVLFSYISDDPTLTPENVVTVLQEVRDVELLCLWVGVPENKATADYSTIALYGVSNCVNASWAVFVGKLFFLKETSALEVAKRFLCIPPPGETSV